MEDILTRVENEEKIGASRFLRWGIVGGALGLAGILRFVLFYFRPEGLLSAPLTLAMSSTVIAFSGALMLPMMRAYKAERQHMRELVYLTRIWSLLAQGVSENVWISVRRSVDEMLWDRWGVPLRYTSLAPQVRMTVLSTLPAIIFSMVSSVLTGEAQVLLLVLAWFCIFFGYMMVIFVGTVELSYELRSPKAPLHFGHFISSKLKPIPPTNSQAEPAKSGEDAK